MAMDLLLLPSLYEGLPVVGIEAQASGLPCILSDTITQEVALCDVKFESIKREPEIWVKDIETVVVNDDSKRREASNIVASLGYDINIEAGKLYNLYKEFERT